MIKETQRNIPVDMEGLENIIEKTQKTAIVNINCNMPKANEVESYYNESTKVINETLKKVGEKLTETL